MCVTCRQSCTSCSLKKDWQITKREYEKIHTFHINISKKKLYFEFILGTFLAVNSHVMLLDDICTC